MQTAPPPPTAKPRAARRSYGYLWLGMTAFIASIFGLGVGTALRFRVVPTVGENRFSPDQSFPPLADWPPKLPRADRSTRDTFDWSRDTPPQRRLLPAAEAATSNTADSFAGPSSTTDPVPVRPDTPSQALPSAGSDLADFQSDVVSDGVDDGPRSVPSLRDSAAADGGLPGTTPIPDNRLNEGLDTAPTAPPLSTTPRLLSAPEPTPPTLRLPDKSPPTPLPAAPAPAIAVPTPASPEGE